MKLRGGGLRESRQAFDAIDLEIGFAVAGDGHEVKQIRCTQHGMALKELQTGKPVGRANDRTRAALNMANHPGSDFLVIMGEIKFGYRFAVARTQPKDLSGIGNQDAHGDRLPCFAGRGPCLRDSCRSPHIRHGGFCRLLRLDFLGRLVVTQAFEGGLPAPSRLQSSRRTRFRQPVLALSNGCLNLCAEPLFP
jgi:hypothetical protein